MGGRSALRYQQAAGGQSGGADSADSPGYGVQDDGGVGQSVGAGLAIEIPHPLAGSVPQVASPIRLSETPVEYRNAPPLLGEHTEQILGGVLGLGADDIERLRGAGVL